MSNRAKFLVVRSAQLPANQKFRIGETNSNVLVCVAVGLGCLAASCLPSLGLYEFAKSISERVSHVASASMPADWSVRASKPVVEPTPKNVAVLSSQPEAISLVTEQAEQDVEAVAQDVEQHLYPDFSEYNHSHQELTFFGRSTEPFMTDTDCLRLQISTAIFACAMIVLLQISKVQQSLRFIRRRLAFQLGLTSRGGSAAFRNRRKGQISYLTKHFFDQQLVRITLCLIMIAPVAAIFCLSQPPQQVPSATIERSEALPSWLNWKISQSKGSDYWADWQASPYGKASAAANVAHVNWPRVFFHVFAVLGAILSEWRLVVPLLLMLLFFRSARQAKVSGKRFNPKQRMRQSIQYIAPSLQVFLPAKQNVRKEGRVAAAPVLQISGKQQRFAQWKIKLKQRALH